MNTGIQATQAVPVRPAPAISGSAAGWVCAGYTLQERLGVGGYGEVWRAIGPGGLHKAVKILHGFQDGPQAELELKSLERMRDLRHPFLLNIERIEVVDGRLVIVSELAEGSLENRFEQLCREGRPGIPRDELLGYLRDAADALDFMSDQHGLQHLDIKPANLLLQGGRVKVADFGLIKDVRQTQLSLVGGYTPRFAPPELFEGRPSRSSDQYSLAIVYQLLATGAPPFAGRTTAQLAAQHLSSPPDLSSLTPADRPAVGRALSKNPQARFPGCRAFVDQLSERSSSQRNRPVASRAAAAAEASQAEESGTSRAPGGRQSLRSAPLGTLSLDGAVHYRPTLVIGLGGLGGAVLRGMRQRLRARFGQVPAMQFLYLDTDFRAISALLTGDDGLRKEETGCIELRRPDEYRRSSRNMLEWLSRRWLFNIPRSGQVQGMRPLGRLALVDHQDAVRELIRQRLGQACSPEALEASRASTGLPFETAQPDVVLVASVSGGTGGGAVLDTAYMLRQELLELGLEGGKLLGLLLHGTSPDAQHGTVQRANAVASLRELKHFYASHLGYPGDAACRLPASSRMPFDHVYFVHLGEGLSEVGFARGVETVADYLHRSGLTAARRFLEACRGTDDPADAQARGTFLRSFGVSAFGGSSPLTANDHSNRLCRLAVRELWAGAAPAGASLWNVHNGADDVAGELGLRAEPMQGRIARLLASEPGQQIDRFLRERLSAFAVNARAGATSARVALEALARDCRDDRSSSGALGAALQLVRDDLTAWVRDALAAIRSRTLSDAGATGAGLSGAGQLTRELALRVDRMAVEMTTLVTGLDSELAIRTERCLPDAQPATPSPSQSATVAPETSLVAYEYGMLAVCSCVHKAAVAAIQTLRTGLAEWEQTLTLACQRLRSLEAFFGEPAGAPPESGGGPMLQLRGLAVSLLGTADPDQLSKLVGTPPEALELLADRLLRRAAGLLASGGNPDAAGEASEHNPLDAAWPFLTNVGGGHRVLAVTPVESVVAEWQRQLEQDFGPCVTLECSPGTEPFLCCEAQQLDYHQVERAVMGDDDRIAELAGRLHTRADIAWHET